MIGGQALKEQYIEAIIAIMRQYGGELEDAWLPQAAEKILAGGLQQVRAFSARPDEATIVQAVEELSQAETKGDKIIAVMTLAFMLGTTKMPTDVAIGLFDELLFRLFDSTVNAEELTAIKAIAAALYTTATENSPF